VIPESSLNAVTDQARLTRAAMSREDLRGYDPYDALLSPLFRLPILRSKWLPRFGAQQVVLRSKVNLRGILRVPPQVNPVTVGLYVQGVADLVDAGLLDKEETADEVSEWVSKLEMIISAGYSGPCWGYPFPWEGRQHRMPTDTPTIVATSMVVSGLHRVWQVYGDELARSLTVESSRFVLEDLPRTSVNDRSFCWAYSPVDDQQVLNATLKGSRLLVQAIDAGLKDKEADRAREAATASVRFVMQHQESDGGWPYAVGSDSRTWRDHHHTGYLLECLNTYSSILGNHEFDHEIEKGWTHYRGSFFDADDLPRYYDDRDGPLDATAAGQALITLAQFDDAEFGFEVATACLPILAQEDGTFTYRRSGKRLTKTHFIRWSTAWMFAGMARLLSKGNRSA